MSQRDRFEQARRENTPMEQPPGRRKVFGIEQEPPEPEIVERVVEVPVEVVAPVVTDQAGITWVGNIGMSPTGLVIPDAGITMDEWSALFNVIRNIRTAWQFVVGDWIAYGNDHFEQSYEAIAELTGYKSETIESFASTCRNVPQFIRVNSLSFGHHRLVSALPLERQLEALQFAAQNELSVQEFRSLLRGGKRKRLSAGAQRKKRFHIIDRAEFNRAKNADENERRKLAQKLRQMADELYRE